MFFWYFSLWVKIEELHETSCISKVVNSKLFCGPKDTQMVLNFKIINVRLSFFQDSRKRV